MIYFCTSQALTYRLKTKVTTSIDCLCLLLENTNNKHVQSGVFAVWLRWFYAPKRGFFSTAASVDVWIPACLRRRPRLQPLSAAAVCVQPRRFIMGGAARLPHFCPHYALLHPCLRFLDGIARVPHSRILPDWDHVYEKIGLNATISTF